MQRLLMTCASLALTVLAGCSTHVQTTSGQDYLDRYATVPVNDGVNADFDSALREAASIEPVLRFPARIGLARIGRHGRISDIPEAEAEHWKALRDHLGPKFGELVPMSPMLAQLARGHSHSRNEDAFTPIERVRLAAARQHLDAVLIYEVNTVEEHRKNALSAVDFTLISAFLLPSRGIKGHAVGSGLLIDVVQGYPYGTVQSSANESTVATAYRSHDRRSEMADRLRTAATANLAEEAEQMFAQLAIELAALPGVAD